MVPSLELHTAYVALTADGPLRHFMGGRGGDELVLWQALEPWNKKNQP